MVWEAGVRIVRAGSPEAYRAIADDSAAAAAVMRHQNPRDHGRLRKECGKAETTGAVPDQNRDELSRVQSVNPQVNLGVRGSQSSVIDSRRPGDPSTSEALASYRECVYPNTRVTSLQLWSLQSLLSLSGSPPSSSSRRTAASPAAESRTWAPSTAATSPPAI